MILVFKTHTLTTRKEKAIALILAPQIKSSNDNGIISVTSYFLTHETQKNNKITIRDTQTKIQLHEIR